MESIDKLAEFHKKVAQAGASADELTRGVNKLGEIVRDVNK